MFPLLEGHSVDILHYVEDHSTGCQKPAKFILSKKAFSKCRINVEHSPVSIRLCRCQLQENYFRPAVVVEVIHTENYNNISKVLE